MTNAKRFPADEAIHHTGQRGPMVVLASDHDTETDRLQRHLDSRNEQIDGYERQLGIDKAGAEHTIGSEIERLTREGDVSRAAIEQLHAAVKTAQELAATRLMEIERLKKREKDLMDVIDSRDRALGFVPLDEVHASRTGEAIVTNEQLIAIEMKPLEGCAAVLVRFNRPFTHVEMNAMHRALNEHLIPHDNEPFEQLPAQLAWGLESKLPGEDWKVYWALYSDRDRAEQAAKNGRPEGTEWRVVTYARMPEGASRDASSEKSENVKDSCGPGCAMGANRPAQKSDEIRDLACCDKFVRESASEFCAICGYTNLDHLRKRSSSRT